MVSNPLRHTSWVAIELSNLCDWASIHKFCPLSLHREKPKILDTSIVLGILRELGESDYSGCVAFHRYNEPLTDPRLYWLVEQRQRLVPLASTYLCTNARYLSPQRVWELAQLGVQRIHATLYDCSEERGKEIVRWCLRAHIAVGVGRPPYRMDLLEIYEAPKCNLCKPCGAPLWEVVITSDAQVGLCCRDWKNQYTFGSLKEASLSEILASAEVSETYERLVQGDRFLDLCSRCDTARLP